MTLMSVCYMALTYTLTSLLGPVGMVLANCVNMVVRIVFAVRVIQKTYEAELQQRFSKILEERSTKRLLEVGNLINHSLH